MARIVVLDAAPNLFEPVPDGLLCVTPHTSAADAAGSPHISLQRIAKDELNRAGFAIASEVESEILLKRSIFEVEKRSGGPASSSIRPILETVLRTGIDPEELEQFGSPRVRQFARIAREYEKQLRSRGLVDRSAILWRAAHLDLEQRPLFIYGYFRARKEEAFFINAVAGEGSIYHLPCDDDPIFKVNSQWAETLKRWGWTLHGNDDDDPQCFTGREAARRFIDPGSKEEIGGVESFSYPDIETEVRAVLGGVKVLVADGTEPWDVSIVCRDVRAYASHLSIVASEYGLPVKIGLKIPLAETFTGSFVSLLLDCVEGGCDRESVMQFLRHPYSGGIEESKWPQVRASRLSGVDEWKAIYADIDCLAWPETASFGDHANCLLSALQRFGVRDKSGIHAREARSYTCFSEALSETADLEGQGPIPSEVFITAIREILTSATTDFDPRSVGIRVCEPNVLIGGRFKHVFVLGLAEGVFPARSEDNAIIDFHERKQLIQHGIEFEEAAEVPRWEALSFYFLMLSACETLQLSYPRLVGREVKIESSFFERLGTRPVNSRPSVCASPDEMLRVNLRKAEFVDTNLLDPRRRFGIELERESLNACGEYDGAIGEPIDISRRTFSVSQLTTLGQCGFKWFAKHLLRLSPAEELETHLAANTQGSFYHRVLEIASRKAIDGGDIRTRILEVIADAFDEAESEEGSAMQHLLNWSLQRAEHIETLKRAIESGDFIRDGAEPQAFEVDFETEWEGFRIRGKVDRIDRTPEGLAAIDYKTGSSAPIGVKNEEGKAAVDLQIAIYTRAALPALFPKETLSDGVYYSLTKGKRIKSKAKDEELAAFAERARAMLRTGNFSVGPDVELKACTYCDFDIVCRNGHRIVRKTTSE